MGPTGRLPSRETTGRVQRRRPGQHQGVRPLLRFARVQRPHDSGSAEILLLHREIVCVGQGRGLHGRVAVPDKDYVFQKEDIIICVLPDVEEAFCVCLKPGIPKIGAIAGNCKRDSATFWTIMFSRIARISVGDGEGQSIVVEIAFFKNGDERHP